MTKEDLVSRLDIQLLLDEKDLQGIANLRENPNFNEALRECFVMVCLNRYWDNQAELLFENELFNTVDIFLINRYLWWLYNINTDESIMTAYIKGNDYVKRVAKPEGLYSVMVLICFKLKKITESIEYNEKSKLNGDLLCEKYFTEVIIPDLLEHDWKCLIDLDPNLYEQQLFKSNNYEFKIKVYETHYKGKDERKEKFHYFEYLEALFISRNVSRARASILVDFPQIEKKLSYICKKECYKIAGKVYEVKEKYIESLEWYKKSGSFDDVERLEKLINENRILEEEVVAVEDEEIIEENFKVEDNNKEKLLEAYSNDIHDSVIEIFEEHFADTDELELIEKYIWSLYKTDNKEKEAYKKCKAYIESSNSPVNLYSVMGHLCLYFKHYEDAKYYYEKAIENGKNCLKDLNKVNDKLKEQEISKIKEEYTNEIDELREKEVELENEEEDDNLNEEQSKIKSQHFKSAVTRGGSAIFPEHIYIDNQNVIWEKKDGVFSKDSISIPIEKISSVKVSTSLINNEIINNSSGYGSIHATNFTKSDVIKIKRLIEQVQNNL